MRGDDCKIPVADALQAHQEHMAGWSLRALARMRWEQWGYASPGSALEGLRCVFRNLDLPIRGRVEATVEATEIHGNLRTAYRRIDHPHHRRYLEQTKLNQARRRAEVRARKEQEVA